VVVVSTPTPVQEALRVLWRSHRDGVDELIRDLRDAVDEPTPERREAAARAAHRLAGSLGTFGLAEGTSRARDLEAAFADRRTEIDRSELASAVEGLASTVARFDDLLATMTAEPPIRPSSRQRTVAIVGFHPPVAAELAAAAAARGLATWILEDLTPVADGADERAIDGLVVDVDRVELTGDDGSPWPASAPSVVAVSAGRRLADRVAATRQGARRYVQQPATAADIVASVQSMWAPHRHAGTIVAVDDDPMILDTLRVLLTEEDVVLVAVDDPEQFWKALHDHQPHVVMLDVDMPGISGIELCRVLRSDDRWQQTGVIFLTARRDAATVHAVFEAGADDMVVKPIIGPELRARIASRIERTDLHRRLAESDGLTGLTNRGASQRSAQRMAAAAASTGRPFSVALVDLDHFKAINDEHGHHTGDAVLRRFAELVRDGPSIAGRWGGEEFLLAFDGWDADRTAEFVDRLLADFGAETFDAVAGGPFRCTFSAGVAELDTTGEHLDGLVRRADEALYRAKAAGRRRVVVAVPREAVP
jgi:diguanylate cyclase (GGDEF)-like protein